MTVLGFPHGCSPPACLWCQPCQELCCALLEEVGWLLWQAEEQQVWLLGLEASPLGNPHPAVGKARTGEGGWQGLGMVAGLDGEWPVANHGVQSPGEASGGCARGWAAWLEGKIRTQGMELSPAHPEASFRVAAGGTEQWEPECVLPAGLLGISGHWSPSSAPGRQRALLSTHGQGQGEVRAGPGRGRLQLCSSPGTPSAQLPACCLCSLQCSCSCPGRRCQVTEHPWLCLCAWEPCSSQLQPGLLPC